MNPSSAPLPKVPGVGLWLSITFLWGTVFYGSSTFFLKLASSWYQDGTFNPGWEEFFGAYGVHAVLLVLFALLAMLFKRAIDPKAEGQNRRRLAIAEGKGERLFISFAGSVATGFFFALLTAASYQLASVFFVFSTGFTLPVLMYAALMNIGAGLGASLFVGLLFLLRPKKG